MSLKVKAIKSFSWTLFQAVFSQGFIFIVGVILARILSPKDFGVIGIITAFIAVTNSIIEGGFSSALIRKVDANNDDYNTVFYTNLCVGFFLYFLLFISSGQLALYFEIPILSEIFKYSGIILVLNALSLVQAAILSKMLDFKTQAIISIISSVLSGITAIVMAYNGYGVWSLVVLSILRPFINSVLLWFSNNWRPSIRFSKNSFNELFNYGYKVLIAKLINTIYKNIYYVLIGKYFSPAALGYYTRAEQFQSPVSGNITSSIGKISFPILSSLQNDKNKLKMTFIKFLRFTIFLNFPIMLTIAALAKPLIILLIGAKWLTSISYLQLLCIPGMFYPLQILHINLLLVKGYSDLNLKIEVIKKIILLPLIFLTVLISIKAMIYGLILFSIIEYFINSYFTKKLIGYTPLEQIKDILPFMFISIMSFTPMYLITYFDIAMIWMLLLQLSVGLSVFVVTNEIVKLNEYLEVKGKLFILWSNLLIKILK